MRYKLFGNSGLRVSELCLGSMTFGEEWGWGASKEESRRLFDTFAEAGGNFIDTANHYTEGTSERYVGEFIAAERERFVLATKYTLNSRPDDPNGGGNHRKSMVQALDASLKRLGTDCIDLYQLHWPERPVTTLWRSRYSYLPDDPKLTPIKETLGALGELVAAGKVRAIGVCNESAWGVMRYLALAEDKGLPRLASIQNGYSLLDRYFELGLAEIAMREGVGLIGYSPLARGLLTGKHLDGGRAGSTGHPMLTPNKQAAVSAYVGLAREHGLEPSHMALAFARQQPFMASVLMAASSVAQLESNIGAIGLELPKEVVKAINAIHDLNPNPK